MPTIIISRGSIVSGCAVRGRELDSYLPTSLGAVPGTIPFSPGAFTHRSPIDRDVVDNHSCPDFPRRTNLDSRRSSAAPGRSDGGTATYDAATTNAQVGTVVFDYTVLANQTTPALEITKVNLNSATVEDINGSNVDFALALNQPVGVAVGPPETIVSKGEVLIVSSGQTSNGISILSGGKLIVSKGGTAHDITVSSGGALNVAGTITSDVTVFAGGGERVSSGGVVSGATGAGTVISGGTVNVLSGGKLEFADVDSGGKVNVKKGGTAHDLTVSSGGALNVAGTITSDVTVFSGGVETVSSGGVVSGASGSGTDISGGTVNVLSGGKFEFAVVDGGGDLNVSKGGTAHDILVSSGGTLTVAGTITSDVFVESGGVETVSSGGLVTGSLAGAETLVLGTVNVLSGGKYGFSLLSSGGTLNVSKGGTAHDILISSGGHLNMAGTITSHVAVFSGGVETVRPAASSPARPMTAPSSTAAKWTCSPAAS